MNDLTPTIERHRHELVRRNLTVTSATKITPNMLRLVFSGDELAGFTSLFAGDHFKLFIEDSAGEPVARDYTPRHFDPARNELTVDFALHEAGPATQWALNAAPGTPVKIAGPRGSQVITGPIERWVMIGDETALPAIGRQVEELPADMPITTIVAVPDRSDAQGFTTKADHVAIWVPRADPTDPAPLINALEGLTLPPKTFVWVAAESAVARALRDHLTGRGHPLPWLKAAGYWVAGEADSNAKDL
ncbi:NADPH-dependent ferric siderophore reductase [Thioclava sp. SK-1]|uniref:siderophore-interacting protein n=1 Tax=Thioclava sp. SK-1 TaxID=1889770 RepID=UPI0008251FB3|nr:siderophore-interacting protein [Thioclava sp. SK-1]OCX65966.1 NADPH-dependent ferric siderophore reductase [Thioclava sp. SK-1]